MNIPLETRYGFLGAIILFGSLFVAQTSLVESPTISWMLFNGLWLAPYIIALAVVAHKRHAGYRGPVFGVQFITSLWELGFAIVFAVIFAVILALRQEHSALLSQAVIFTVGLWEDLIKALVFALITTSLWEIIFRKKT